MPEGDTIRRLAERINRRFAGERCERSVTRDPRLVHVDFAGTVLREADARGKHLLIRFDDARTLFAHLRMDGSFTVGPVARAAVWRRRKGHDSRRHSYRGTARGLGPSAVLFPQAMNRAKLRGNRRPQT